MPAYKRQFLYKAIDSILKQSQPDFELIIVNDASPDNLESVINKFQDQRIRYIVNSDNLGGRDLVANWNHCIQFAHNDYVILATDDDVFEPNYLKKASHLITTYPDVDIIRSGVKKIDENEKILDIEFPLKEYMTAREFALFYAKGGTISCISNYIFKAAALKRNNGFISFPHAHYSDDATVLSLSYNGVACIQTNEFAFRVSNINLSNQTNFSIVIEQIKATELYMEWYLKHISKLNFHKEDFFERACYGGYKIRYITMIEKLTDKIPIYKFYLVVKIIFSTKNLFRRERLKLFTNYIINKLR